MKTYINATKNNTKVLKKSSVLKFIRAISVFLGLSVAIGSYEAEAKLPLNVFKGVTPSFNKKYTNFSPTLGMAALDSSIIYNLRFFGNFDYKNREKPIDDVPLDAIAVLVKEMFPSNTGELGVGMTAPQWLSNNLESPLLIAKLLDFVNTLRESDGQDSEREKLKLIEELKENWEKEYPVIKKNRRQFQLDYETVLKKEPSNFNALKVALKKMVVLNVEKTTDIFKKKANPNNDIKISIFNDIVDFRNSLGNRERIDAILDNAEMDNEQKLSKIKKIIESEFVFEKNVKDENNKGPVINIDKVKADIENDLTTVQNILKKWIQPKDLKEEIKTKQTNFPKKLKDVLQQYETEVEVILDLNIPDREKLDKIIFLLQHQIDTDPTIKSSVATLQKSLQAKTLSEFPIKSITRSKQIHLYDVKKLFDEDDIKKLLQGEVPDNEKISTILELMREKLLNEETVQKIISELSSTDNKENNNNHFEKIRDSSLNDIVETMRKTTNVSSKKILETINNIYGNALLDSNMTLALGSGGNLELTNKIYSILNDKEVVGSDKIRSIIRIFLI